MSDIKIASRYAKSLIDLSTEKGSMEKSHEDVVTVLKAISESRDLRLLIQSPVIKTDKKISILKAVFADKISPVVLEFILLLAKKRRESLTEEVLKEFEAQYLQKKNVFKAVVTSAVGLDDNLRKQVLELVKKNNNSEVELIEKVDKSIIGGFILRIGDEQIDKSILRQLKNLRKNFNESSFVN